jgi:hypothetical protein
LGCLFNIDQMTRGNIQRICLFARAQHCANGISVFIEQVGPVAAL